MLGSFKWVYAVLSPVGGYIADRFSRRHVIAFSLCAWSFVTWWTGHVGSFHELVAARALMGVSEACYIPAALALIADFHGPRTRSLANGVHLSGVMVGAGLGGVGGWIAERHGWAQAFEWFGQGGIVLAIVAALYLRERRVDPGTGPEAGAEGVRLGAALTSLFSTRQFLFGLAFWSLLGASAWAVVGWMPTYLTEQFKLSQGAGGLSATAYNQGAQIVGVLFGGYLADRWSRTQPNAPVLVPLIGVIIAGPAILLAAGATVLPLALAGLVGFGLTKAFADANMMPILTLVVDRRYRATGYGVLNFAACLVGGATIYAGGVLRDARIDVSNIFLFGAACIALCAVLLHRVLPRPQPATKANLP